MSSRHLVVVGAMVLAVVAVGVATQSRTSTLPDPAGRPSSATLSVPQNAPADALIRPTAVPSLSAKQVGTLDALLLELADLRATVDAQVPDPQLVKSLDTLIDAAAVSVRAAQYRAAVVQLDTFGNQLDAAEQTGKLGGPLSNVLKRKSDTITNSIANIK